MGRYSSEIKEIWAKADEEDRETSPEERGEVEERLKAIETLKEKKAEVADAIKVEDKVNEISTDLGPAQSGLKDITVGGDREPQVAQVKSLGEMFVQAPEFKAVHEQFKSGVRQQFSTGAIPMQAKGTLTETAGSGLGLATPAPQVIPGVTESLFQRLSVADLLMSGQATTSSIRYVVEGTATSGAAGVAEGAAKPESTLGLSTVDEPVKKIATVLSVSDEMLEDAAQVQSYINGRLSLFVKIEEERQLLRGTGTNELVGIIQRSGVNTYARGTVDNNAVALFKALNGTRGSAYLEPDAIIMNPANWQTTRLLTDTAGQFFGGGPFLGPYGGPQGPVSATGGQLQGGLDTIWGKPVVVTSAIGAGTALLGSFGQAAQVYRRGGLSIEASNSHDTYFTRNLVAIRAEMREGLAVYRPSAFTVVSGLA